MEKKLTLTFIRIDNWDRPVYKDDDNKFYVDTDPNCEYPEIHTKSSNDIEGEPDFPVGKDVKITFIPSRITW